MSETKKKTLVQKLFEIRKKLDYFKKGMTGNQKVKYVDPEIVLGKARKYMDEFRVLLIPSIVSDSMVKMPNPTANQPEHNDFVSCLGMSMTWIDVDNPEDTLMVPWYATGSHRTDPSMAFGGALTYTERYFLLKFFQIPTGKDDPEFHKNKISEPGETISIDQATELTKMIIALNRTTESFCEYLGVDGISNIPLSKYKQCKIDLAPLVK